MPDPTHLVAEEQAVDQAAVRRMEEALASEQVEEIEAPEAPPQAADEPEATPTPETQENAPTEPTDAPEHVSDAGPKAEEPELKDPEPQHEEDDVDKEIAGFKLKKDAKPVTQKNFEGLRKVASTEHKKAKEAERRAAELAAEVERLKSVKQLDEPTEKELNELRLRDKQRNLENDPEFKSAYDDKIKAVHEGAFAGIRGLLPEATAKAIEDKGGLLKFRVSQDPIAYQHEDGSNYTCAEFFDKLMLPRLTPEQRDDINSAVMEERRLNFERNAKLQEAKNNVQAFEGQRMESAKKQQEEWATRIQAELLKAQQSYGDMAVRKEVPATATADEKKAIDEHNATIDRAEGIIKRHLQTLTPESHAQMSAATAWMATVKPQLDKRIMEQGTELKTRDARIKELEAKLDDIKNAGKTSHRQSAPTNKGEKPKPVASMSAEDRMNAMLEGKL